jgi:hypothetical protein
VIARNSVHYSGELGSYMHVPHVGLYGIIYPQNVVLDILNVLFFKEKKGTSSIIHMVYAEIRQFMAISVPSSLLYLFFVVLH